jgi:hypothetical protein
VLPTEDRAFALDDEVLCLRNAKRLGVLNGTQGTVVGLDLAGLHIETTLGPRSCRGVASRPGTSPTATPPPCTRPRAPPTSGRSCWPPRRPPAKPGTWP